jgi:hypothetical protein
MTIAHRGPGVGIEEQNNLAHAAAVFRFTLSQQQFATTKEWR